MEHLETYTELKTKQHLERVLRFEPEPFRYKLAQQQLVLLSEYEVSATDAINFYNLNALLVASRLIHEFDYECPLRPKAWTNDMYHWIEVEAFEEKETYYAARVLNTKLCLKYHIHDMNRWRIEASFRAAFWDELNRTRTIKTIPTNTETLN